VWEFMGPHGRDLQPGGFSRRRFAADEGRDRLGGLGLGLVHFLRVSFFAGLSTLWTRLAGYFGLVKGFDPGLAGG
jgi:hypothetical protein